METVYPIEVDDLRIETLQTTDVDDKFQVWKRFLEGRIGLPNVAE